MTPAHLAHLEQHLLHPDDWKTRAKARAVGIPDRLYAIARRDADSGVPTGLVYDAQHGWCVIQSSGQGPYLVATQNRSAAS